MSPRVDDMETVFIVSADLQLMLLWLLNWIYKIVRANQPKQCEQNASKYFDCAKVCGDLDVDVTSIFMIRQQ